MSRRHISFDRVAAEITCADCTGLINKLTENKIPLQDIRYCDELTFRANMKRTDFKRLEEIAVKYSAETTMLRNDGFFPFAHRVVKRPVLLAFLIIILFLSFYLPSRVLFITVQGNAEIPARYILEVAAECGIEFGAERRLVRSEMMKNRLLERIPQLQWAGINTSGCTAVIAVREKSLQHEAERNVNTVSSIVAARDGVIQSCTVLRGNPLCSVGQAVKSGQTLVSGYLDCGLLTKTTQASAEIKALTFREVELFIPSATAEKGEIIATRVKYSLRIGKKLIKFYKDGGNLDTTCGKIYTEEYVRLPGGFTLPVAIVKETVQHYDRQPATAQDGNAWIVDSARNYLKAQMVSGEVISEDISLNSADGLCYLYGKFTCMEMIGQIKYEQTVPKDG